MSGTVTQATLRVYANSTASQGISVRGLTNPSGSWSEDSISYSTAPAISPAIIATSGTVSARTWVDLDVTSLVTGNGTKQLALTTAGSTAISLVSRHAAANVPQLVVEYR